MVMRNFDFEIATLGGRDKNTIRSPISLSNIIAARSDASLANFVGDDEYIRFELNTKKGEAYPPLTEKDLIEKAGPREMIYFNPGHVHAGIVTCGGLCPGLNDVIRAIVRCLWRRYGVRRISGIRFGFKGLLPEYNFAPIPLNPTVVDACHKTGGSILGTSRGGGNRVKDIVDGIEKLNLNMLFVIGGDGTQKGALEIAEEIERRNLKIAIVGIPKTVDNDLAFIQKSFGFDTAVVKASEAVAAARMEAQSQINGIGLVKLMGRESGFIATHTAIASHEADFVLIPEVPFDLEGENGFLKHLEHCLEQRQYAVVIVAEGAGQEHCKGNPDEKQKTDASGNKRLADIGLVLKEKIEAHFKAANIHINLKYIDPSYQIRSAPAAPIDSIYCERLGNNAVHAAMAGKTKLIVGLMHTKFVHLPIKVVVSKRSFVEPQRSLWRDTLDATGQPVSMRNPIQTDPHEKATEKTKDVK